MTNIVVPRPLHLDRSTEFLRKQGRFQRVIALRLSPESAAEQCDVDCHVLLGNAERLRDVFAGSTRTLHRRPDLGLVAFDVGDRDRRLHGDMGKVRQVIFTHDHLVGPLQGGIDVALLAHDQPRLARGFLKFGPIGNRVVFAVRSVVPDNLQRIAALDRSTGVASNHGDPAERLELGGPRPSLHPDDLFDARNLHGLCCVERHRLAAGDRRPRDDGVLHAGQARVGAVMRRPSGDVAQVDDADLAFAEIAKILRVLQLQAFDTRHRLLRCIGSQIAESDPASTRIVDHFVIGGLHFAGRYAPAFRRRGFKHRASRGADLAHRHQIVPCAARSVGILVAVSDFVAMGLLDADARPVGFHLFGYDQWQAGSDACSHLGTVCDDRNYAIRCDRHENTRVDDGAVRHLARARLVRGESGA